MKTVLILGGSGYLGQFLVQSLTKHYKVYINQQSYLSVHFVTVSFPAAFGSAGWLHTPQHLSSRLWWRRASVLGKHALLQLDHYMACTMQTPEAAVLHMPFLSVPSMQACCNQLPSISQMRFADVSASLLQLDLPTGEGMQQCFDRLGPVDAVINCAAISSPAACEQELDTARCVQCKSPAYWPGTQALDCTMVNQQAGCSLQGPECSHQAARCAGPAQADAPEGASPHTALYRSGMSLTWQIWFVHQASASAVHCGTNRQRQTSLKSARQHCMSK